MPALEPLSLPLLLLSPQPTPLDDQGAVHSFPEPAGSYPASTSAPS